VLGSVQLTNSLKDQTNFPFHDPSNADKQLGLMVHVSLSELSQADLMAN